MRILGIIAILLLVPLHARAQDTTGARKVVALAKLISGRTGELRCQDAGRELSKAVTRYRNCVIAGTYMNEFDTVFVRIDLSGGGSMFRWSPRVRDSLDAVDMSRAIAEKLEGRLLRPHSCGASEVPAGIVNETLWLGDSLAVFLARIDAPGKSPVLTLVGVDDLALMPNSARCDLLPHR